MHVHDGHPVITPLTTPPRTTRPLRQAAWENQGSFTTHNMTLPSGLSPITGGDSPATALDESGPDALLGGVPPHGSPSPRPSADWYYRPHLRRPPPMPRDADSEEEEEEEEEGEETGSEYTSGSAPRLSQVLRGGSGGGERRPLRQVAPQAVWSPPREWRASLPPPASAARAHAAQPTGHAPVNTGLNTSPSPARATRTSPCPSSARRARAGTAPPATPAATPLEDLDAAQHAAQEMQDTCTLARAEALREEHGLRQALEEEARLDAEVRRLEAAIHAATAAPYVDAHLDERVRHIASPLHSSGPHARAQQRWAATHVPLPGTLQPPPPRASTMHAPNDAALEQAIDHRYRLSKLVVSLDEERQRTKFLRARHAHLLEAHRQRTASPAHAPHTASATVAASPTAPVPERVQAEVAEDLAQLRQNLAALQALSASWRRRVAAVEGDDAADPDMSTASESARASPEATTTADASASADKEATDAPWQAALAENRVLRQRFAKLVRAGEEEVMYLVEYYQLLLARLAQRTEALCQEWKATSKPAHVLSEEDSEPIEPRARIVSWF